MKKAFTLIAAVVMLAGTIFAQANGVRRIQNSPVLRTSNVQKADPMRVQKNAKIAGNPVWGQTMSYCGDEEFSSSIGTGDASSTVYWAIKIEAAALEGRDNITDVLCYVYEDGAGSYNLSIYFGETPTGTAAYTQTVTATSADADSWKTIHFAEQLPVVANSDMWVVMSCTGVAYPAAGVDGNEYDNGKYISLDGVEWDLVTAYGLDYTWMIKVVSDTYVEVAPVVSISGNPIAILGSPATFTAVSANAESYDWTVDGETVEGTDNTLVYAFTTAGEHTVGVTASNSAGDGTASFTVNVIDCGGAISEFPFVENFEAENPCWLLVVADEANNDRIGVTEYEDAYQGNSVFVLSSYSSAEDYNQFLITPELDIPEGGNYALRFWYKGYNTGDAFRVKASTTTSDTAAFTTVLADYPTVATTWTECIVSIPAGTKHLAINYYGDFMYYLFIDSLVINEVSLPVVSIDGPDATGTGMEVTYTATVNFADSYVWKVDGLPQEDAEELTFSHIFTEPGEHTVSIEATNDNGSAEASVTVDVFSCDGITIPYNPEFTTGLGCWTNVSDSTQDMGWFASVDLFEEGEAVGQVASMSAESVWGLFMMDVSVDNWLTSPLITMPAEGSYEVAWSVAPYDPSYAGDHYGLYVIDNENNEQLLFEETLTGVTDFEDRIVAIPSTVSGTFRIAFRHFNSVGGYVLILDNIQLRALSPAIVTLQGPSGVEVNTEATFTAASSNAESFAWTVDGNAVSANGNVLTYTFTSTGNHTVAVTATNEVGDGTASMDVNVYTCESINQFPYTQDFEATDVYGCWRFVDADGDGYGWETDFINDSEEPEGHNNSYGAATSASYINGLGALTPDNWLIMPTIEMPAEGHYYLSWYAKGMDESYAAEHYSVYVSTTGKTIADFTTAAYTATTTGNWNGGNVDLAQYAGQTIYVAFRHHNVTDMYNLIIDDIAISTEQAVGVRSVDGTRIAVYPNPVTDRLNVEGEGISEVRVLDLNGRTVVTAHTAGVLDLGRLNAGMYIVRVVAADGVHTSKIVKK